MPWENFSHFLYGDCRANWIPTKSIVYFASFLHEEGSEVHNWSSEQFFKDELMIIFSFGIDFDDTILKEIENCGVIAWKLEMGAFLILFNLQVVNDIMEGSISDVLEVPNFLNAWDCESLHPIFISENGLFELLLQVWEFN